jgi:hypothetical protein
MSEVLQFALTGLKMQNALGEKLNSNFLNSNSNTDFQVLEFGFLFDFFKFIILSSQLRFTSHKLHLKTC